MKKTFSLFCYTILLCASCSSSNKSTVQTTDIDTSHNEITTQVGNKLKIIIGTSTYIVLLQDNPTAVAFKSLLPMTLQMAELNGNEKHVELPRKLPEDATNPGTIQAGDLMLYAATTLVLFYKTFSTTYSYTKVGRIENLDGLTEVIGTGSVEVHFEVE